MNALPFEQPVLSVVDLAKRYELPSDKLFGERRSVHAVDGISFDIAARETLGLVGESGCGKSTAGRTILKLIEPTAGQIVLDGQDITRRSRRQMWPLRASMQVIFQDPYSALNPRMRAGSFVGEPLVVHGAASARDVVDQTAELFEKVGLRRDQMDRYPHEFSGGQRQRICIARALALRPKLIIADEPVSALDVSIQAQVINLMKDLQDEFGIAYLFVAHDLAVVQNISHRVAVMYLGRIVEIAGTVDIYSAPQHPYTELLMAAVPRAAPQRERKRRTIVRGEVPSPLAPPPGCHFHPRCPYALDRCETERPLLKEVAPGHRVACHLR